MRVEKKKLEAQLAELNEKTKQSKKLIQAYGYLSELDQERMRA